ncbi:MAG TPA: sigma-54 dependent transcriptional regulator [Ferruginibacter sp.]|nr:sigma-54 dependent transcriptional regulator [Ferruginibacter sp.]
MKKRILVIDDDLDMCFLLNNFLCRNGYEVEESHCGEKGIEKYKQGEFDVVICDYRLGDKTGIEVLEEIKAHDPNAIILIITGFSDIKTAVEVIKSGAHDYITKPFVPEEILNALNTVIKESSKNGMEERSKKSNKHLQEGYLLEGQSKQSKELYYQVEIVSNTDYNVILYGESGTGKEVVARTIHNISKRRNKPFVAMDCGTLSKELSGSELFGHVKGAFTGAMADKEGHFEMANGGTLFLDEVGNLSYDIQASLLRVIQERRFKRVGGTSEMPLDIRIIVASNENLQDAYKKGKFREDLYHRFNEFSINIPRLSKRKDDIPLFADFFLQNTRTELGKSIHGFEEEVMQIFINYSWPGNLRELRNVIRRAALVTDTHKITVQSLPFEIMPVNDKTYVPASHFQKRPFDDGPGSKKGIFLKDTAAKAEYESILNALQQVNFNKSKAAELLNIDRKTLYNKIRNYESNSLSSGYIQ